MTENESSRLEFFRGARESAPMLIGLLPFAMILGVQGGQKGMSWLEMLLMTGMNFAGGSEFAAVNLWAHPQPIWLIATVTFMINSRHILMGAALAPFLRDMPLKKALPALFFMCDESWAMGLAEVRRRQALGLPSFNLPFYAGVCAILYSTWIVLRPWARRWGRCLATWRPGALAWRFPPFFWFCFAACGKDFQRRFPGW